MGMPVKPPVNMQESNAKANVPATTTIVFVLRFSLLSVVLMADSMTTNALHAVTMSGFSVTTDVHVSLEDNFSQIHETNFKTLIHTCL